MKKLILILSIIALSIGAKAQCFAPTFNSFSSFQNANGDYEVDWQNQGTVADSQKVYFVHGDNSTGTLLYTPVMTFTLSGSATSQVFPYASMCGNMNYFLVSVFCNGVENYYVNPTNGNPLYQWGISLGACPAPVVDPPPAPSNIVIQGRTVSWDNITVATRYNIYAALNHTHNAHKVGSHKKGMKLINTVTENSVTLNTDNINFEYYVSSLNANGESEKTLIK